jgi:pSer/pThr/pTyr-binding forkhead associated (FHA) protein
MAYDRILIRDLGSRNGVRVNGRPVDESRLQDGDELAIGPILFRLETATDNPEAQGVPPARPAPGQRPGRPGPPAPSVAPPPPAPARSSRPDSEIDLVELDDL